MNQIKDITVLLYDKIKFLKAPSNWQQLQ